MEQSEGFKEGQALIKEIEKRLAICTNIIEQSEKTSTEAQEEIEEHFATCFNALAARKEELLREVNEKVTKHKTSVELARVKLETSLEACKKTLESAILMYTINSSVSEHIITGLKGVTIPNVVEAQVTTDLSSSILQAIRLLGKVNMANRFLIAENISTLAGSVPGHTNGSATDACFFSPISICVNPHDEDLYVCEWSNNSIRKVTMQGNVQTLVSQKGLMNPSSIAMNHAEKTFFVTNFSGHSIFKITAWGTISPFAGSGKAGSVDGVGKNASFHQPKGITVDQSTGNLFVCDSGTHLIRKITPQGEVSTLAGSSKGFADGCGKVAQFNGPCDIFFDATNQSLVVCDRNNKRLRKVLLNGEVSTLLQLSCSPSCARAFNKTILVCSDHQVFEVDLPRQKCISLCGSTTETRKDGTAETCGFNGATGITIHEPSHTCFVADFNNHLIRKISFLNPN